MAGWQAIVSVRLRIGLQLPSLTETEQVMSGTGWAISMSILYVVLVCTIALLTFRKGHWVLGLLGFVFPILWLIGAVMPARRAYR
jgi:hypothetical protein